MKKQFLMLVAIVVLALPLNANYLTPQLCEEETSAITLSQKEECKQSRVSYMNNYCETIYADALFVCYLAYGGSGENYNTCVQNAHYEYERCLAP